MADIWTVLVAGVIGALGPLVTLIIQGRQTKERDQETHERSQKDAKREQIRSEYAALLQAMLTFYNLILSFDAFAKLSDGKPMFNVNEKDVHEDAVRLSALLRDTLNKFDKATVALLLLEPGMEIISEELRRAMEDYTLLLEYPSLAINPKTEDAQKRLDTSVNTILQQGRNLRKMLPERIAKL
ncbi:MAG TPA: hypothetical protein VKT82_20150 [Ktedonobacterales bacterium]|nr:hypothetical protein [Ktedonobacterales bacterium]